MADNNDYILEVVVTADESDDWVIPTAVNYYHGRNKLDASDPFVVPFEVSLQAAVADTPSEVVLGMQGLMPTHIRISPTFQA